MSERFARHELIPGWSQQPVSDASVVVAGVGALGNEVTRLLAPAGVSRMLLCDPDRVEESNLSRTPLFRPADIGRWKVEAAADALRALAPGISIEARAETLSRGIGLAELRDATLVLSCLDTRVARLQLAARCALVRAPIIDGGTNPWGGEVRVFLDPDGPCYGCTLTSAERAESDSPWSCMAPSLETPTGASAFIAALAGAWMSTAALRFILGLPVPKGLLRIDAAAGTTVVVEIERKEDCPLHSVAGDARVLSIGPGNTVEELRTAVGTGELQAWEPVQQRVECPRCGFAEARWEIPRRASCPRCGRWLRVRTTLDLQSVPGELALRDLGIPPREILYVKAPEGAAWVEIGN